MTPTRRSLEHTLVTIAVGSLAAIASTGAQDRTPLLRDAGIHRVAWDLRTTPGALIDPGTYAVRRIANGRTHVSMLTVERDPNRLAR